MCVCVCVAGFGVWTVPESVRFVSAPALACRGFITGAWGLPRCLGFSCMCTAWLPVVPVVGAAPLCLCLVPRWRRVLCDVRVVCWFDAFTAAWSGIAVGGWTNVARPLVLIVARVRYRGRLWVPVTKRRSSRACIGNPNPEQETIKGTHAQETAAHQRRPATQHAAQGSNPPIGALYMQLVKIPPTHQTTPPATRAASADQHGTHRGCNRYHPSTHTTKDEAPGQLQAILHVYPGYAPAYYQVAL